jgi:hypothetical protein
MSNGTSAWVGMPLRETRKRLRVLMIAPESAKKKVKKLSSCASCLINSKNTRNHLREK